MENSGDARDIPEKLLILAGDDGISVALYVDEEVVGRLATDDPTARIHTGNLSDYCTALEGVSHFLYLTWNAGYDRGVSLLELEMQAEVDKYVGAAMLFGCQRHGRVPAGLYRWLFEAVEFDSSLDSEGLERYRNASRYAGKYCARLEDRYLRGRGHSGLVNELRRFYRLTQRQKIDCIEARA